LPEFDPTLPGTILPDSLPPSGPAFIVPPIDILPNQENPAPLEGPDEGGEDRDFPVPPEIEPLAESDNSGAYLPIAEAGPDAGDGGDGGDGGGGGDGEGGEGD